MDRNVPVQIKVIAIIVLVMGAAMLVWGREPPSIFGFFF